MAETIYTFALTTVARVKDRLGITVSTNDAELLRIINGVTDLLEGETGRRFLRATVTNEVHEIRGVSDMVPVKQAPLESITSVEYSTGIGSNRTWVTLDTSLYEIMGDGKSGLIKVWGGLGRGINAVRVTYVGGYKIAWAAAGDNNTHTLPADLTDLAERIVTKYWKRREAEGKSSEGIANASIQWRSDLEKADQHIIDRYRRLPELV